MNVYYDIKKNIPDTIRAINNTYDVSKITYYENQLACMLSSPLMFLGGILCLIHLFFLGSGYRTSIIINATAFFILGVLFEIVRISKFKVLIASRILTGLYIIWFLFAYSRLYPIIGPAVWTIAANQIIFSMSRLRKDMAVYITTVVIGTCLYTLFNIHSFVYEFSLYYLVPQTFLLILLCVILSIAHRINKNRYERLYKQYCLANEQKSDITALYEELIASEDELREQNKQLTDYNNQFIAREQKLHSLAYYDTLTGLPNRAMFMEQLQQFIQLCSRETRPFYLVLLDVDAFRQVNSALDHAGGDQYLLFVVDHLRMHLKEGDILSRIDGDEFALLLRRDIEKSRIHTELESVIDCFSQSFQYNGVEYRFSASYGSTAYPAGGSNASELLKSADMALEEAKAKKNKIIITKRK